MRGYIPRPATSQALADSGRIVAFGCDLGALAPAGVPVEQWADVPAVSDGYAAARAAIAARLPQLLGDCRAANM